MITGLLDWLRRRFWCWYGRHDLVVYVSCWDEFPALISCDCRKVEKPANVYPLSERP